MLPKMQSLKHLISTIPFLKNDIESVEGLSKWIETLQAKRATDVLTEEEAAQIKMEVESVKSSFDNHIIS